MRIFIYTNTRDDFYYEVLASLGPLGAMPVDTISEADATIVLGGDGSTLAAARSGVKGPVVVINTGHLGFLTSSSKEHYKETIANLVAGTYTLTERHLLDVDMVYSAPSQADPGSRLLALNDVVIAKAALSKLVKVAVYAVQDGREPELVSEYRADGLVISTPTGSTAYSLSAGGSIIHPSCPSFIITPICPQALTNRPVVLPSNFSLQIRPLESSLYMSIDGQIEKPLHMVEYVSIKYNSNRIVTVNPTDSYFEVLRKKLSWGIKPV